MLECGLVDGHFFEVCLDGRIKQDRVEYTVGSSKRVLGEDIIEWERTNAALFEEGVISRLPAPTEDVWNSYTCSPFGSLIGLTGSGISLPYGRLVLRQDVVLHLSRTDIKHPQIFLATSKHPAREVLKACQAESVFTYLLPRISLAHPDQILQVREKVKDTREGFSMHLQKLTEGLESKLKGGEQMDEIRRFAQSTIETKLIPDYREYVRQLLAEKAGFWGKILDPTSKLLQIDAAPWTPKFYGEFIKALGFTALAATSENKQRLSNASQAYQFMHSVEKSLRQLA